MTTTPSGARIPHTASRMHPVDGALARDDKPYYGPPECLHNVPIGDTCPACQKADLDRRRVLADTLLLQMEARAERYGKVYHYAEPHEADGARDTFIVTHARHWSFSGYDEDERDGDFVYSVQWNERGKADRFSRASMARLLETVFP